MRMWTKLGKGGLLAAVLALAASVTGLGCAAALAKDFLPHDWQTGFPEPVTPVMQQIVDFHDFVFAIIVMISLFVVCLLGFIFVRFNATKNPEPSTTTHSTILEIAWTVIPIIILVVIAIPSFKILYYQDRTQDAEMTFKAIGNQWYWTYVYPDYDEMEFDAIYVPDEELEEGQPRLLTADETVVLPTHTNIRFLTTATDVIHAWTLPNIGMKMDAVPGRINESWFRIEQEGMYYGQCSELCGTNHGFMPIMVKAVSKEEFDVWIEEAMEEYARNKAPDGPVLAANRVAGEISD